MQFTKTLYNIFSILNIGANTTWFAISNTADNTEMSLLVPFTPTTFTCHQYAHHVMSLMSLITEEVISKDVVITSFNSTLSYLCF